MLLEPVLPAAPLWDDELLQWAKTFTSSFRTFATDVRNAVTPLLSMGYTPAKSGIYVGEEQVGYYDAETGTWKIDLSDDGTFSLTGSGDDGLDFDGENLTITGTLTAGAGSIGGWSIGTSSLSSDGNAIILNSSGKIISIGSASFGSLGLQFDYNDGAPRLYAGDGEDQYFKFSGSAISWKGTNAELTEGGVLSVSNILATGGTVAGFTIDGTEGLYAGAGATRVQMKAGSGIWAGATAIGDAPFSVTNAGVLKATSGQVGGFTLSETKLEATGITLQSGDTPAIMLGGVTGFGAGGDGLFAGKVGELWKLFLGDPEGDNFVYDGEGNVVITGAFFGTMSINHTNADAFAINADGDDIDVQLIFQRTTGGAAVITWNGDLIQTTKPLKPTDIAINRISSTEPETPFAGMMYVHVS